MEISRDIELRNNNGKLILRPTVIEDGSAFLEAIQVSKTALALWTDWYRPDFSIEFTLEWLKTLASAWEKGNNYQFAIIDGETNQLLGSCGINHINR